jgi:hypothetical protein
MLNTCTCGHDRRAHQHYRGGSDCSRCAPEHCPRYRADTALNRLIGRLAGQHPALSRRTEPIGAGRRAA